MYQLLMALKQMLPIYTAINTDFYFFSHTPSPVN